MSALTPALLNTLQADFSAQFSAALSAATGSATHLVYLIASLELVFFGLSWALKRDEGVGTLLIKLIKIGFIIYFVSNYSGILNAIGGGFAALGGSASATDLSYLSQPLKIFQYTYDASMSAINVSMQYGSFNFGASLLYLILGFGSLLLLALIAAQIIFVNAAFYAVALTGLIVIPMSAFKPATPLLNKVIQHLLKAGIRILVLMMVLSIALTFWHNLDVQTFKIGEDLAQPISFFFAILILTVLTYILPRVAAAAVGEFSTQLWGSDNANITVHTTTESNYLGGGNSIAGSLGGLSVSTQAGTSSTPMANIHSATSLQSSTGLGSNLTSGFNPNIASTLVSDALKGSEGKSELSKQSLQQLKKTLIEALEESWKSNKKKYD